MNHHSSEDEPVFQIAEVSLTELKLKQVCFTNRVIEVSRCYGLLYASDIVGIRIRVDHHFCPITEFGQLIPNIPYATQALELDEVLVGPSSKESKTMSFKLTNA